MNTKSLQKTELEKFCRKLSSLGRKATRARIAVHTAMLDLGHASADMVSAHIEENTGERISVSSVYNILSELSEMKIYGRRLSSNNKMYFDVKPSGKIHLYNTTSNEYRDIVDEELGKLVESHMKGRRFKGMKVDYIDIQIVAHSTSVKTKKAI